MSNEVGKGDSPRPRLVSRNEYEIRYELAYGDVSDTQRAYLHEQLDKLVAHRKQMRKEEDEKNEQTGEG